MGMPDIITAMNEQNIKKEGIGIVILIEDKDHIKPQEDAKKLSAETGFAIVKYRPSKASTNASSKSHHKHTKKKPKQVGKSKSQVNKKSHDTSGGTSHNTDVSASNSDASDAEKTLSEWQLVYTTEGLALRLNNEPAWGDILVDFNSDALNYRKQHGGGRNEALARAIGIKGSESLSVIDCTAGMGSDSFVMASVGANVLMLERSPVIAALLEDALARIEEIPDLHEKLSLIKADATDYLLQKGENSKGQAIADVIYLDPMFPHKKKSALVKKEMRAFQQLLGADMDSAQLLEAALSCAGKRVVVKRPSYAEPIEIESGRKPSTIIESKKHRFDVYIQH
jgi:16S rRNA (guanine1516-N2)-methyltransferase